MLHSLATRKSEAGGITSTPPGERVDHTTGDKGRDVRDVTHDGDALAMERDVVRPASPSASRSPALLATSSVVGKDGGRTGDGHPERLSDAVVTTILSSSIART